MQQFIIPALKAIGDEKFETFKTQTVDKLSDKELAATANAAHNLGIKELCDAVIEVAQSEKFDKNVQKHIAELMLPFTPYKTIKKHTNWVTSVCFSPKEALLASGSYDHTFRMWRIEKDNVKMPIKECINIDAKDAVAAVCFSPDGTKIAYAVGIKEKIIVLCDAKTGELIKEFKENDQYAKDDNCVNAVCFSPDGTTLATGVVGNMPIKLWNVETGECKKMLENPGNYVRSLCFNPDGKTVASGLYGNGQAPFLELWNVQTHKCIKRLEEKSDVYSVCFSPDGTTLATGRMGKIPIKLGNVETGECIQMLTGHKGSVDSVCFSPSGNMLASASYDKTIKIWNIKTGECIQTLTGHKDLINSVCFNHDGTMLASGSADHTIKLWILKQDTLLAPSHVDQ